MEYNLIMAYADGASVRGTPGLFYPADKARVDYLWRKIHSMDTAELSFAGDVEGYTLEDTVSGAHTVFLTVDGLDDIKAAIDDIRARLEQLDENANAVSELTDRLNSCEASLDAVAEEQLSYFKVADFSTVDGSLVFYDGLGSEAFTIGGATFETLPIENQEG